MTANLPSPQQYPDWKTWASALIRALLTPDSQEVLQLRPIPKARVPSAKQAGLLIYVPDATGGAVPCFSDGTNWRRVSDLTVLS